MNIPRGRGALAVVLVLAVLATGCSGPEASPAGAPSATVGRPALSLDDLTGAGLVVAPDEAAKAAVKPGQLLVTRAQADRLVAEQEAGGGVFGLELDRLAPMPAGAPPMSYLLAAWVAKGSTPNAATARRLMGSGQDWRHARQVLFPLVVPAMFVTDAAQAINAAAPTPSRTSEPSRSGNRAPAGQVGGAVTADPCTAITTFLSRAIKAVFDALKLSPATKSGLPFFVRWLADVWDYAVDLARGIVQAVVDKLTRRLFDAVRSAIGALTVATVVVSYFTKQTLTVSLAPPGPYRFAVGAEPDVAGEFVAQGNKLTSRWPDAVVGCANATGKKLPELLAPGARARWKVDAYGVITPGPVTGSVGQDLTTRLRFVTGRESDEQAKGPVVYGAAVARVEVERHEIRELVEEAKAQVKAVINSLLSALPIPQALLDFIFDPMLNEIAGALAGRAGNIFAVAGTGSVTVQFHRPPQPTPTPTPSPTPSQRRGGDFCVQYRAMAKWSYDHQAQPTPEAWAGGMVRRLTAMRPLAPAARLHQLDALLRVYRLVAAGAGGAAIGDEAARSDFPGAGRGLALYCKVDPRLLRPR